MPSESLQSIVVSDEHPNYLASDVMVSWDPNNLDMLAKEDAEFGRFHPILVVAVFRCL
jgi:hypothetical protein